MQKIRWQYQRRTLLLFIGITASLATFFVACSKHAAPPPEVINVGTAAFPSTFNFNCTDAATYQDTILCARYMGPNKDYIAKPINNPQPGKYYAWPAGLQIDENTGAINVTRSESGVRYVIGFVKEGSTDTCHSKIIIAGIHYLDNVYVLADNDTLATPYFNADPLAQPVCDPSDDNDYPGNSNGNGQGNDKCEFDDGEDDDNGNGSLDEPPPGQQANDQNVRVRTISGIINLKKSVDDVAFGQAPQNGDTKDVSIYYRLSDCSIKALRMIRVRLMYYDKKSDIPAALLAEVQDRKSNFENGRVITKQGQPRPPLIIVTRQQ